MILAVALLASTLALQPPAPAQPPAADARVSNWREDLSFLASELPRRHANAFFACPRQDFEAAAAAIDRDLPALSDSQVVVRFMQLAAMLKDFHTGISPQALPQPTPFFPVSFAIFSDGPVIGAARERELIGCAVVKFGDTPIEEALRRAASVAGYENEATFKSIAPRMLITGSIAHALGLCPAPDRATITVRDSAGAERTVELTAMTPGEKLSTTDKVPLARQKRATANWYEPLPERHAIYFHYERCADDPTQKVIALTNDLLKALDASAAERLIIDLRGNGGGNSGFLLPLIQGLKSRAALNRPGGIIVLINRGTFSSAQMNAAKLRSDTRAVLIGEPTGQKPNSYGEVKTFKLPHSQIEVRYSTKFWKTEEGDRPSMEPDVRVEPSSADYLAGKDPVMEAALEYRPG